MRRTPMTASAGSPGEDGFTILYSQMSLDEDEQTEAFLEEQFMHDDEFLNDTLVREMGEMERYD